MSNNLRLKHLEFLLEDQSGGEAMKILIPKLFGDEVTYYTHAYKGLGHIPKNLNTKIDANKRVLLNRLPKILQGLGDLDAVKKAYPKANVKLLQNYVNDSICGTWETLADATVKSGHKQLQGYGVASNRETKI